MKRIGIIGENYHNDARAFAALLTPQYEGQAVFVPILKSLKGGYDNVNKVITLLPTEIRKHRLDAVICTHDLDNHQKLPHIQKWYQALDKAVNRNCILYLAVMEMEALILADVETFNELYSVSIQYKKNPKHETNPKRYLMDKTNKAKRTYHENHAEDIFSQMRFHKVYEKHVGELSFQEFIDAFNARFDFSFLETS
jgi:hypothetical protein